WRDGVHLAGTALWLDAPRRHHVSFVSHARVPIGRAGRVLATPTTATLCGLDDGDRAPLLLEYGRRLTLGPAQIELQPSGQMGGAAQALCETDRGRILYARDIAPDGPATAAPLVVRRSEMLIVGAFLASDRGLPPRGEALGALVRACEAALATGDTPVLL